MKKLSVLIVFIIFSNFAFGANDIVDGWETDLEQAKEDANRLKKPIMLFLHSVSCFYCPKVIEQVLPNPDLAKYLKNNFVRLELDTSTGSDSIESDVTDQAPPRFIVSITPAYIFMGPNEEKLARNGKKHMIVYGFWDVNDTKKWAQEALKRFKTLYGDKYK
ncbi:MAG: thioredoxin family protein [Sulfurospirillum sp.]